MPDDEAPYFGPPYAAGGTCPVCHEGQIVDAADYIPEMKPGILSCPVCWAIFCRVDMRRRRP